MVIHNRYVDIKESWLDLFRHGYFLTWIKSRSEWDFYSPTKEIDTGVLNSLKMDFVTLSRRDEFDDDHEVSQQDQFLKILNGYERRIIDRGDIDDLKDYIKIMGGVFDGSIAIDAYSDILSQIINERKPTTLIKYTLDENPDFTNDSQNDSEQRIDGEPYNAYWLVVAINANNKPAYQII